ncbi:hypothetical protein OQJ46_16875 [Microbulbifer thermotolerans]|uniref:Uncharacterized protein n=1 Tax=Microbulbifer thermotolerans TaxID=252514 RepID=A0AB35I3M4_MICTH|nr:hypothetical protein [Microbulbifer thermotolerans]MCX2781303.1 hypothetical protein [Microbulbifer thermotolerans]MCX2784660.1 hypothetical protein [Microbulbifer thermotolerans]MCX2796458.1 hypothetical protein [Microbulbifer thermotolerans]MCX2803268.1 hypothetical protein [Microbulbifer thermotolerans]MCX2806681.1 hypothetical protein [Microbulbifer thermotolerans]
MDYELALFTELNELGGRPPEPLGVQIDRGKVKISGFYENTQDTLESVIVAFLKMLDLFDSNVFSRKSVLQVAVYHMLQEAVTFTVRLSSSVLDELSSRGVSIEITAYPCDE